VNGRIVEEVYEAYYKTYNKKKALVTSELLKSMGWKGLLPTSIFKTFGQYRIRLLHDRSYEILKVSEEMLSKKPVAPDMNEPLPIDLGKMPRVNLRSGS